MAGGTSNGSVIGARFTKATPSDDSPRKALATANARRVFPTQPGLTQQVKRFFYFALPPDQRRERSRQWAQC